MNYIWRRMYSGKNWIFSCKKKPEIVGEVSSCFPSTYGITCQNEFLLFSSLCVFSCNWSCYWGDSLLVRDLLRVIYEPLLREIVLQMPTKSLINHCRCPEKVKCGFCMLIARNYLLCRCGELNLYKAITYKGNFNAKETSDT